MAKSESLSASSNKSTPNYPQLVRFLLQPLLEKEVALKIDCEELHNTRRVWIRVAFESLVDKGRVFGRGGRNIGAIKTILKVAATNANQLVYLDIYDHTETQEDRQGNGRKFKDRRPSLVKP